LTVLDAYAGSGALGFEALSRGAIRSTSIDVDKGAYDVMLRNAKALNVTKRIKIIRANAVSWSANNASVRFNIVILDPPYDNVQPTHLIQLASHAKSGGLVICSLPPAIVPELPPEVYEQLMSKSYGDATLSFYRRIDG
jgi:16S rRNA (guanine966-N2)-methyltransferase